MNESPWSRRREMDENRIKQYGLRRYGEHQGDGNIVYSRGLRKFIDKRKAPSDLFQIFKIGDPRNSTPYHNCIQVVFRTRLANKNLGRKESFTIRTNLRPALLCKVVKEILNASSIRTRRA